MKKEFVSYEIALAMKELGFDEPCLGQYFKYTVKSEEFDFRLFQECAWEDRTSSWWNENISENNEELYVSAPLSQQALRWFREEFNFEIRTIYGNYYNFHLSVDNEYYYSNMVTQFTGNTYEKAEEECLKGLISIIKKYNDKK